MLYLRMHTNIKEFIGKKGLLTSALGGNHMYKVIHSNIISPFLLYIGPIESKYFSMLKRHKTIIKVKQSSISLTFSF